MANKYDWEFIRPLDQTANIAAMAQGNQQINAGLQGMSNAVTGYADAMKQRNTDEIMNALMGAQTSVGLPQAMQAVQALQQQYGRGYDQAAVRNAIDTRGTTLGQRDLQAINLQQAQAAQAAIPQLNQVSAAEAIRMGANPEQMNALAALGIDTSGQTQRYGANAQGDTRYNAGIELAARNRKEDQAYRASRDVVSDAQWAEGNRRAEIGAMASLAKNYETPAQSGYAVDANGNIVTTQTSGTSFSDAMALMPSIFNAESGNTHRDSKGNLTRSPVGALGVAQIMPKTAAKPGYGMQPINLQTSSANEQKAWATEYIGKIQKAHNFTTDQAVAAYNAGPGAVQQAIKEGGSKWLSKLPKETQNYVPKVMGGARGASAAIGASVPQAAMSKVTSGYQDSIAKATRDFAVNEATAQTKGSLAATGKNVDTWLASKDEFSLTGGGTNPIVTRSADIAKMARNEPMFKALPAAAQLKVLDGAYGFVNSTGLFEYVPNAELKKFIRQESTKTKDDSKNQFNVTKKAIFEQSYQDLVQAFQASGSRPPSREAAKQLLDPQYKPKQTAQPQPVQPKPVVQAPKTSPIPFKLNPKDSPAAQATKALAPKVTQMDKNMADRAARKQAEFAAVEKRLATKEIPKSVARPTPSTAFKLPTGATNLSQKDIEKMLKEYKVR